MHLFGCTGWQLMKVIVHGITVRIFDQLLIMVWTLFPPSSPFCCLLWWLRFLNWVAEFIMLTAIEAVSECFLALNWFLSIFITQLINSIIVPGWIGIRLLRSLMILIWIRCRMVSVRWESILYVNQCQKGVQSASMAHYLTKLWEILLILHTSVMRLSRFIPWKDEVWSLLGFWCFYLWGLILPSPNTLKLSHSVQQGMWIIKFVFILSHNPLDAV